MDTESAAFCAPEQEARKKLLVLLAIQKHMGIKDEDLPIMALQIAQTMEVLKRDFLSVTIPMLDAPPHMVECFTQGMVKPLADFRAKLDADSAPVDALVAAAKEGGPILVVHL